MPSAGAVAPPKVVVLRDPRQSMTSNKIDSETFIELVCDTPHTKIYFSTDGTKPNPFQIGVAGRESTFKYKAPFQLKEGKRTIKSIAISRDGLQESAVITKTFQVDSPPDYDFDDDSTFIESFDSMSTTTCSSATTESTVKSSKKHRGCKVSNKQCQYDQHRPRQQVKSHHNHHHHHHHNHVEFDLQTISDSSSVSSNESKKDKKHKKSRSRSHSPNGYHHSSDPRQAWIDGYANGSAYPSNHVVPWNGQQMNNAPMVPVTAGTVFYPTVNARAYSPEPDVGYLTNQMIKNLEAQRKMTIADVRDAVRELATPRQAPPPPPAPPAVEYQPPRYPEPKACSPGNGNWREQLEHIYAHLIEHAQVDPDFRIALGEPKMGRVIEADFVDGDDDTLIMTVAISRYGQARRPKPKLQTVAKVATAFNKPPPQAVKKAPVQTKPPSRKPSVTPVQPPPPPPPAPEPEPVPERDPDPYFVTEEYPQEGTLKPFAGFDAEADCEKLRGAMKGLGTNEDAITSVLGARSATQRVEIAKTFKTMFGKDLIAELKSELSGNYLTVCTGLCLSPAEFDAKALNKAIKGLGTDEQALVEILCTRTNAQIKAFTATYKTMFNKDLEKDIEGDTSGHFKRLLIGLLQANRDESDTFDQTKVEQDATKLYDAGEQKKFGTDESRFNVILVSRSYAHLRAVFEAYQRIAGKDIEDSLKSEMSGDLLNGMLTVVRCIKDKPSMFAKVLYKSMKGLGTDDESLLRVVISRCEVDMVQIKEAFQRDYKQTLGQFIRDDTSGDYRKILLALIADPNPAK